MNTKFDKLYNILSENPDAITLKSGRVIKWNSRHLNPIVFSAYKNCVVYIKSSESIRDNHGDINRALSQINKEIQNLDVSDEEILHNLFPLHKLYYVNFNREILDSPISNRVEGRFWQTNDSGIISFWNPSEMVKTCINGIDSMIQQLGYDPLTVKWDPGYLGKRGGFINSPPVTTLMTRKEYFDQIPERRNPYVSSPEGRHEIAGMKKALGELTPADHPEIRTNFLANLGRGD